MGLNFGDFFNIIPQNMPSNVDEPTASRGRSLAGADEFFKNFFVYDLKL